MKKELAAVLAFLLLLCTGCGGGTQTSKHSFAEMYPNLCPYQKSGLSPEQQETLRQAARAVLETAEGYEEETCTIFVKNQWVEATLYVSDEWLKAEPEDWDTTRARAEELAQELDAAMKEQNFEGVLHLSDKKNILFTAVSGKLVFDKFNRQKHYEPPPELDRERIDEILQSAAQRREETGEQGTPYFEVDSEIVYVSNNSDTIHSIPDCSGMVHYREMSRSEADSYEYEYCENCW